MAHEVVDDAVVHTGPGQVAAERVAILRRSTSAPGPQAPTFPAVLGPFSRPLVTILWPRRTKTGENRYKQIKTNKRQNSCREKVLRHKCRYNQELRNSIKRKSWFESRLLSHLCHKDLRHAKGACDRFFDLFFPALPDDVGFLSHFCGEGSPRAELSRADQAPWA
jgi:hypothetical protein